MDHLHEGPGDVRCRKHSAAVQQHEAGGGADSAGQEGRGPVRPLFKRMVSLNISWILWLPLQFNWLEGMCTVNLIFFMLFHEFGGVKQRQNKEAWSKDSRTNLHELSRRKVLWVNIGCRGSQRSQCGDYLIQLLWGGGFIKQTYFARSADHRESILPWLQIIPLWQNHSGVLLASRQQEKWLFVGK